MIRLSRLCAGYFGKTVIQEVTMEFLPGKVTVLLGPNGSGKSTLLKASLGLLPLTGGEVLYDDVDIRRLKRRQIAQKAAFLTQSRNTPSIQALRMVLHGRFPYLTYPRHYGGQDYAIARSAMDATGSRQHENTNVSLLSGGQRQGVYLAMALAQDTGTLFMDEPTTYLDISRQFQMMHTARSLAREGKSGGAGTARHLSGAAGGGPHCGAAGGQAAMLRRIGRHLPKRCSGTSIRGGGTPCGYPSRHAVLLCPAAGSRPDR